MEKINEQKKYDLEERLILFASLAIDLAESLPGTVAGKHISGQLVRAGTSPCLNYGEALSAESRNDFIHKMRISLKELRESRNCLRIIKIKSWFNNEQLLSDSINENQQLIAIFVKSIETAKRNRDGK